MPQPTPTQSENDRAAMGEHVMEKEPDGSEVDPSSPSELAKKKQATPTGGAPYQTRQVRAAVTS